MAVLSTFPTFLCFFGGRGVENWRGTPYWPPNFRAPPPGNMKKMKIQTTFHGEKIVLLSQTTRHLQIFDIILI